MADSRKKWQEKTRTLQCYLFMQNKNVKSNRGRTEMKKKNPEFCQQPGRWGLPCPKSNEGDDNSSCIVNGFNVQNTSACSKNNFLVLALVAVALDIITTVSSAGCGTGVSSLFHPIIDRNSYRGTTWKRWAMYVFNCAVYKKINQTPAPWSKQK